MDSEEERVAATVVKVVYLYIHVLFYLVKQGQIPLARFT